MLQRSFKILNCFRKAAHLHDDLYSLQNEIEEMRESIRDKEEIYAQQLQRPRMRKKNEKLAKEIAELQSELNEKVHSQVKLVIYLFLSEKASIKS